MRFSNLRQLIFIILCAPITTNSFDRSFFYRASSFWDEPRFEINTLSTLTIQLSGGSTRYGKNKFHKTTSIFGIYGKEQLVPTLGNFIFTGAFDLFEINVNLYQNIINGFFLHVHLPVVTGEIFPISCHQVQPFCYAQPDVKIDQAKLLALNEKLKRNNISLNGIKEHGLSDSSLLAGWSINYEHTTHLDFLDLAVQLGLLLPTGKKLNPTLVFDIPLGYNGHWGIPWIIDFSVGAYEWFTWGLHHDGIVFFNHTECIPANQCPTGLLRLSSTKANIKSGPVWRFGTYAKADHICWGLSFLMAFTFEQKNRSKILWIDDITLNLHKANQQEWLKKWHRLIYQFVLEYDFAQEKNTLNNRIAFIYNHQIMGKRVFSTDIFGGYFGFDVLWCF